LLNTTPSSNLFAFPEIFSLLRPWISTFIDLHQISPNFCFSARDQSNISNIGVELYINAFLDKLNVFSAKCYA